MNAQVGDHLVVHGHKVGEANREGEIVEVLGPGGTPPYRVRWTDGHDGVVFPSSDAMVTESVGRA
jgi:hypothetical protein